MAEKVRHKKEKKLQLHSSLVFREKSSSFFNCRVIIFSSQTICMLLAKETKTNFLETSVKMLCFDSLCVCTVPTILILSPETCEPKNRCLEKPVCHKRTPW